MTILALGLKLNLNLTLSPGDPLSNGQQDFKVCDWPPESSLNGQSQTLKSCWPIKTSLSWLSTKLKKPQDQVGHLSLGLNGHQPSETSGHFSLLQCTVTVTGKH